MKSYLSEREILALEALLKYRNHSEAARECGIPLRTINNWMDKPYFRDAYNRSLNEIYERTNERLVTLREKAIQTLEDILDKPDQTEAIKLKAIKMIIDFSKEYHDITEKKRSLYEDPIDQFLAQNGRRPSD